MKGLSTIIIFVFVFFSTCKCQPPTINWQKCYGGSDADNLRISRINSHSIYLLGGTFSNDGDVNCNHGDNDGWLLKIQSNNIIDTVRCFGGSLTDGVGEIDSISLNNCLILGSTQSNDGDVSGNHGSSDSWLIKSDSSGSIISQKCFGGTDYDFFSSYIHYNNGYLMVGGTSSNDGDVSGNHGGNNQNCGPPYPCSDGWVAAMDSNLNILWQKCYGGTRGDAFLKIFRTQNGNYLIGGGAESFDGDITNYFGDTILRMPDIWLIEIDSLGNIIWSKSYGGSDYDEMNDMCEDGQGGYIILASTQSNDGNVSGNQSGSGFSDIWTLRIDSSGNILWQKCFGGSQEESGASITQLFNGNFAIAGSAQSGDGDVLGIHNPGAGIDDVWILEIDLSGNLIWNWCYGGSSSDNATNIIQNYDSTLIFTAVGSSIDGDMVGGGYHGFYDAWVVKLTPYSTYIPSSNNIITHFTSYISNNHLSISCFSKSNDKAIVELIDLPGHVVLQQNIKINSGKNIEQIETLDLAKGIYFVRLITNNGLLTKKILIF